MIGHRKILQQGQQNLRPPDYAWSNPPRAPRPIPLYSLTQARASYRRGLAAYNDQSTTMGFKSPLDVLKQGIARAGAGPYDQEAVQRAVASYKSDNKVVVFSWTTCVAFEGRE